MTETQTCPRCGRTLPDDAPRGLCPACLLGAALRGPGDAVDEAPEPGPDASRGEPGPATTAGPPGMLAATAATEAPDRDDVSPLAPGAAVRYFGDYEVQAEL